MPVSTLYLNNSTSACRPMMRTKQSPKGVSSQGGQCEACGIEVPVGLEQHEGYLLCPFCHLTQHLFEASRIRAGRIVWLPKISQTALNRFTSTMFMLSVAPASHTQAVKATLAKMESIYKEGFERDGGLIYEQFLRPEEKDSGASSQQKKRPINFPFSLHDPLMLAHALEMAPAPFALPRAVDSLGDPRTDGLRLLFYRRSFEAPLMSWREHFYANRPPEKWIVEPENDSKEQ